MNRNTTEQRLIRRAFACLNPYGLDSTEVSSRVPRMSATDFISIRTNYTSRQKMAFPDDLKFSKQPIEPIPAEMRNSRSRIVDFLIGERDFPFYTHVLQAWALWRYAEIISAQGYHACPLIPASLGGMTVTEMRRNNDFTPFVSGVNNSDTFRWLELAGTDLFINRDPFQKINPSLPADVEDDLNYIIEQRAAPRANFKQMIMRVLPFMHEESKGALRMVHVDCGEYRERRAQTSVWMFAKMLRDYREKFGWGMVGFERLVKGPGKVWVATDTVVSRPRVSSVMGGEPMKKALPSPQPITPTPDKAKRTADLQATLAKAKAAVAELAALDTASPQPSNINAEIERLSQIGRRG